MNKDGLGWRKFNFKLFIVVLIDKKESAVMHRYFEARNVFEISMKNYFSIFSNKFSCGNAKRT